MVQHKRAHKWAFPLGVILTALAVVGAVSLARLAVDGIRRQIENPEENRRYETFLEKIILHDPDPFDDVGAVPIGNIPQLLDISIWFILKDDAMVASLPTDETDGGVLISAAKVEASYEKLFGSLPPTHASIEGSDFSFVYDPDAKVYRVPVGGSLNIYIPRVIDIRRTGSAIELTVNYLAANDFQLDEGGPVDPEPAKTMLITLFEQENAAYPYLYRVGSIRQQVVGEDYVDGEPKLG